MGKRDGTFPRCATALESDADEMGCHTFGETRQYGRSSSKLLI
jgi:hypothetical protein